MKTILYMAVTANALIAREDGSTPWSDTEWYTYAAKCRETGNLVLGRKTYELMCEDGTFDTLGDLEVVVVTRGTPRNLPAHHTQVTSPAEALEILEAR